MKNRICPSEDVLSEYLNGLLSAEDRIGVEKHLAGCAGCRQLLVETQEILKKPDIREIKRKLLTRLKDNRWLIGALITLALSFIFSKYFLQFLAACLLMGAKWIIDAKTTKMLILIHEAWKRGDRDKADEILSQMDSKK